ncbi:hypothetical protein PF006_g30417 [Phytophthora fragariae]|uniref:Uncharacterized protein n=1 Tax=Phytophthora fragariae TaxID=53985 RepID=A0A6A3PZ70_9STRA|nr:hypothetical protein PF006_g30417 [Phytophthora fragariae]
MVIASIQVAVLTAALVAAAANAHSKMSLPKPTWVYEDGTNSPAGTVDSSNVLPVPDGMGCEGDPLSNTTPSTALPPLSAVSPGPTNCAVNYPDSPASFSYDKAACEGKSSSDSTTSTSTTTSAPTTSSTATTAPSPTTASPSSTEASSAADGSSEEASTAADYDTASAASEQTETTAASTSAETATSAETEAPQATTTTTGAKCSRRRS